MIDTKQQDKQIQLEEIVTRHKDIAEEKKPMKDQTTDE